MAHAFHVYKFLEFTDKSENVDVPHPQPWTQFYPQISCSTTIYLSKINRWGMGGGKRKGNNTRNWKRTMICLQYGVTIDIRIFSATVIALSRH